MKKLLIASDNYLPRWDGITRFLVEILPYLNKDFDLKLLVPEGIEGNKIIPVKKSRFTFGDFRPCIIPFKTAFKQVKDSDIIFCQTIGSIGFATIIASWIQRKKLVYFTHSIEAELVPKALNLGFLNKFIANIVKFYTKRLYNRASLIIVPSEGVYETLTWMKIKSPKEVVNLGVNTEQFSLSKQKREELRKKLGIEDEIVIGYHGRLSYEKDLNTLLRAFIRLRRKHPNTRLLVVGEGIYAIRRKLEMTEGVILPGSSKNVEEFLSAMDIYVLPSLTETTCLSALEAMSCKLPVISTPVGYVQDYITEGITGTFFNKKDSFSLSKQLELLINNPALRKKLGMNARKMVEKKFRWENTSEKITNILSNLCKEEKSELNES